MVPNAAKALAAKSADAAPAASFGAMLARVAQTGSNALPGANGTAQPALPGAGLTAAGLLPQTDGSLADMLFTDLAGLQLQDTSALAEGNAVTDAALSAEMNLDAALAAQMTSTDKAAADLAASLPLTAHSADTANAGTAVDSSTAALELLSNGQIEAPAVPLATPQSATVETAAGALAVLAAASAPANTAGGAAAQQIGRAGTAAASARQTLAQQATDAATAHRGASDTAAQTAQAAAINLGGASFALADHELKHSDGGGRVASVDTATQHSDLSALLNNRGMGQPAPVAGAVSATLATPLGTSQWQQDFSQQMVNLVQRGEQRVALHLNPANLGPLVVDLEISEQHALLQFASAHSQVRSALEMALPQLREALAEQGITLGETHIGSERDEQQASSFRGDSQPARQVGVSDGDPAEPVSAGVNVANTPAGRVNLYV